MRIPLAVQVIKVLKRGTTTMTFLGLPQRLEGDRRPKAALFAAGHGSTYPGKSSAGHAEAPAAIRAASAGDAPLIENWDFDLGGPLFEGGSISCIDMGDLDTVMHDNSGNRALVEARTRDVLALGAVPILVGGDCSLTIPFLAGFAALGPIWVLQIDAHIDWREEIDGERYGYSSPMRRASEMAHVAGMVQLGMRSVGSAARAEVDAAMGYGSRLITTRLVQERGVGAALDHIPEGANVVIALDCDAMDPAIMPGVAARTPGGLSYLQIIDLIHGASKRGRLAGFDLVELYPPADIDGLSAQTASRIVANAIGAIVRQP
ncbi:arginase family protein [Rhizobium sp. YIM 134829]|uniref:arginase family protein n=1 Tax=Rhizobium sp. YIM 134829 TaxID=3390453 RepID=UPI00397A549B